MHVTDSRRHTAYKAPWRGYVIPLLGDHVAGDQNQIGVGRPSFWLSHSESPESRDQIVGPHKKQHTCSASTVGDAGLMAPRCAEHREKMTRSLLIKIDLAQAL